MQTFTSRPPGKSKLDTTPSIQSDIRMIRYHLDNGNRRVNTTEEERKVAKVYAKYYHDTVLSVS
ncbi:hypothetical protein DPMN_143896 [Dreissena polymorpha]|uniref:Uncharacterized protein n=1 Tax=Dreissena polymorpha TaxID=45954 RepID=A0A9D4JM33_DREPO|nr:hypothetical protein DPMN_143896 [Dreissena polymorpha]